MIMTAAPEKLTAVAQANFEAMQTLTQAAYAAAERLAALNVKTARSMLEDSVAKAKTLSSAQDLQALASAQSLAQPAIEKTTAYWRAVYEIWADAQKEFTKVLGTELAGLSKTAGAAFEGTAFAPMGSNVMLDAVNSAMGAANSAMERMGKATEQFAEMAQANVAAATDATTKAMGAVAAGASKPKKGA